MGKTHWELFTRVLRTPLQELAEENGAASDDNGLGSVESALLIPAGASKASGLHLNSVRLALSYLAERTKHRAA
jgi:hypothetical protein